MVSSNAVTAAREYQELLLHEHGIEVDVEAFHRDGVGLVRNFASPEECRAMRQRMEELISQWSPSSDVTTFRTDEEQVDAQGSSDRFLDSADQCEFFLEPWALATWVFRDRPGL